MNHLQFFLTLAISWSACGQTAPGLPEKPPPSIARETRPVGNTIEARFEPPTGYERLPAAVGSFAAYLRQLPLKPEGSPVLLFDGKEKWRQDVHAAVVEIDVGGQDLQQCADAVMRLRAEYLFAEKRYDDISFNFTNGFPAAYKKWRQGQRIAISGNRCEWRATGTPSTDYGDFRKYLDQVFMFAGTLSLSKELKAKSKGELAIGDVFIKGGSPGHAVIVVDVAVQATGKKVFMLAQSYMPAQEIHVLKNLEDKSLSPWYSVDFGETLRTPEWTFSKDELKGF
ncbi:MAG: DUF4846 domain-containing protein [Saprospiraceae bacterium]